MSAPVSRRRLVAGAAWAVPAVVVASAVPAFAASATCPSYVGYKVNLSSAFGADVEVFFANLTPGTPYSLTVDSVTAADGSTFGFNQTGGPFVFDRSSVVIRLTRSDPFLGDARITVRYTISPPGGSCQGSVTFSYSANLGPS